MSLFQPGTQSKFMSSSEITLQKFISPVSVCYQDSNLENLITEVKSSKNGIVAIVDQKRSPIGIVHSHHVLSLLTEQGLDGVTSLLREDIPRCKSQANKSALNYHELIIPTVIVSSQLKIRELLPHLKLQNPGTINQQYYLVVDLRGQLLGTIDTNKLLGFLLAETNHQQELSESKKVSVEKDLYKLLDKIPLPLMLKSQKGSVLYRNLSCYHCRHCPHGYISLNSLLHDLLPQSLITELASSHEISESCLTNYQPGERELPLTLSQQSAVQEGETQNTLLLEKDSCNYLKLPLDFTGDLALESNSPLRGSWLAIGVQPAINIEGNPNNYDVNPSNDLVKLNQLKNEFLLNLGHDLKSPLTAIIGLSRLLKAEKLGQLNKRQVHYTDLIYRSGQKLMMIINDLLDMSRVAASQSEINLESLAIRDICEQVYQQVLHKLEFDQEINKNEINKNSFYSELKVPLNLEINPKIATIIADKFCLCQILTHLLDNALKLTYHQGKIAIKVDDWQQWVAITIWDNGMGIPEFQQNSLLEKSFESTNHDGSEGLDNNLGLIFAQKLAQVHGGDISFISTVDKGNNFTVLLPQNPANFRDNNQNDINDSLQSSISQPENGFNENGFNNDQDVNNLLVLIIETVSSRIEDITNKLQELGYHSVIARSPEEALYKACHLKPGKIILNSQLPKTWNPDIIALLRTKSQTRNIPVFVMTSVEDTQEQLSSIQEPILALPLTIDSLMLAFPPVVKPNKQQTESNKSLTILRLLVSSELEQNSSNQDLALDFIFSDRNFTLQHRIIEADSLEQAHILARIWDIDAIVLDGSNLLNPLDYLLSLKELDVLSSLPLITLDAKTTEAANQINGLDLFPCLMPLDETSIPELIQVIQIATGIKSISND